MTDKHIDTYDHMPPLPSDEQQFFWIGMHSRAEGGRMILLRRRIRKGLCTDWPGYEMDLVYRDSRRPGLWGD